MSTPSWLGGSKKEADAAAPAAAEAEAAAAPAAASSGGQIGGLSISKADESDLPKMILFMRIANMGLAIAMITVSVSSSLPQAQSTGVRGDSWGRGRLEREGHASQYCFRCSPGICFCLLIHVFIAHRSSLGYTDSYVLNSRTRTPEP